MSKYVTNRLKLSTVSIALLIEGFNLKIILCKLLFPLLIVDKIKVTDGRALSPTRIHQLYKHWFDSRRKELVLFY
jgi:hypothetical protein